MTLLRVDEIGEFQRIAHEEDRRVIADEIPVAFAGVELQREAAHIALRIGGAELTSNCREAQQQRRFRAQAAGPWPLCNAKCRR